jgi:glycine betaine/proline transport system substrate-binding protein
MFIDSSINKNRRPDLQGEHHDHDPTASATALAACAAPAFANCDKVVFSDVGWTDITATTACHDDPGALGYETEIKVLSVPVTYTALAEGDIDVFLGNWMPTMEADIAPYREAGTVDTVRTNLKARNTRWPPMPQGAALGITDFADIAKHKDALEGKIYGIEPGNDGNRLILDMIAADAFGLTGFEVVESSNRACWRRSPAPTSAASRWSFWAGNRTR